MEYGIIGLLVLILDIIAIIGILQSGLQPLMKFVWIVVVLALPVLGMLLWFILGQKKAVA